MTIRSRRPPRATVVAAAAVGLLALAGCGSLTDRTGMGMGMAMPDGASTADTRLGSAAMAPSIGDDVSPDDPLCAGMRTAAGEGRPPLSSPLIVAGEYHLNAGDAGLGPRGDTAMGGGGQRMAGVGRVDRDSEGATRSSHGAVGSSGTGADAAAHGSVSHGAASSGPMSSGATGSGAGASGSLTGSVGRGSDSVSIEDRRPSGHGAGMGMGMRMGGSPMAWSPHMAGLHGPASQPLARDQPTAEMRCGVDRSEVYVNP